MSLFWLLTTLAAAGVGLCTVFGFLGRIWWGFDWFSHFRVQYFGLLGAAALVLLGGGKYTEAGLWGLFAFVNLGIILTIYIRFPGAPLTGKTYRALLCNVLQENRQHDKILALVRVSKPDFIVLLEVGEAWMESLAPLETDYPYHINRFWGEENYDIALFSRIPFADVEIRHFEANRVPSVVARFDLDERRLTVIGTHPAPPKSKVQFDHRNEHLLELARFASAQRGEVMALGDLNMTSWSPFFRELLRVSGLRDGRQGFGVQPTWPVNLPPLMIPLDHVLVSQGIHIRQRRLGPPVGSDHRPVIVDFSFK